MLVVPACARAKGSANKARHVVLLDSPGLFAPNRAAVFDAQLLAVLNLLSSVVVYNNRGIIDRSHMPKLNLRPYAKPLTGPTCQNLNLRPYTRPEVCA